MIALRLFVALWPDDSIRRQIERRSCAFRDTKARWIRPENVHVTLVFLGATPLEQLPSIADCLSSVRVRRFELTLDFALVRHRSRMLWLTPTEKPPELFALIKVLVDKLRALGFESDSRPYSPHVTLARKIQEKPVCREVDPIHWCVDSFSLINSAPGPTGSIYTILNTWPIAELIINVPVTTVSGYLSTIGCGIMSPNPNL